MTKPSLSSSHILSDCSAERTKVTAFSEAGSKHLNSRCMVTACVKAEQRVVSEIQETAGDQPNSDTTSGPEHEKHFSCKNNACQLPIHGQTAIQDVEFSAFPAAARGSSVTMDKGDRMFTEASTSSSLDHQMTNSQNRARRPLYSCTRKYGKIVSNKQRKWRLPKKERTNQQNCCINVAKAWQYYRRIVEELKENSRNLYRYGRTCMKTIKCIARISRQMQIEIIKKFFTNGLCDKLRSKLTNPRLRMTTNPDAGTVTCMHRMFSLQIRHKHV